MNCKPTEIINVSIKGDKSYRVRAGVTIAELLESTGFAKDLQLLAAMENNSIVDLNHVLNQSAEIALIDLHSETGARIFRNSAMFLISSVCFSLFPLYSFRIKYSISNAIFAELYNYIPTNTDVKLIQKRLNQIIADNEKIKRLCINIRTAAEIFEQQKQNEKIGLLKPDNNDLVGVYSFNDYYERAVNHIVDSAGMIFPTELRDFDKGIIIQIPSINDQFSIKPFREQQKFTALLYESKKWADALDIPYFYNINKKIVDFEFEEIIRLDEAKHERDIAKIADKIALNKEIKIVLIAGPSSSGKTTFAERLKIQLRVIGIKSVSISLDNYFVDRVLTPLDENNNYDYEALEALNLKLFNNHLTKLLHGQEVEMPYFDFHRGESLPSGNAIQLNEQEVIIIEGIHALNDRLTYLVDPAKKYMIYTSALTPISIDSTNFINTTDNRLLRRMIRDIRTRNNSCEETIARWPSVKKGESKNIFPYQENADIMFNSSLTYELSIIKPIVEPLLKAISDRSSAFFEAQRLLNLLSELKSYSADKVPENSILREFIGGSCFSTT